MSTFFTGAEMIAFRTIREERAIRTAKALADKHVGVIAWSREANPDTGEYGPPTTLFVSGDVPDME